LAKQLVQTDAPVVAPEYVPGAQFWQVFDAEVEPRNVPGPHAVQDI